MNQKMQDFDELYSRSIKPITEGEIIKGKIIDLTEKEALVDVGFKSEGIVNLNEFTPDEKQRGKELEFYVESVDDDSGVIILSRQKALHILGWEKVVKYYQEGDLAEGRVIKKIKGGYLVSVMGVVGFMPASLSGFKDVPEKEIVDKTFKFKIIKLSPDRKSMILSRKEALQQEKEEARQRLLETLEVGKVYPGTVKAITDFGAFVDLGGIDGLLRVSDMSWSKIKHPQEVVAVGDKIEVMVLSLDKSSGKVCLGLKQRFPDPWEKIEEKYPIGLRVKGRIVNIAPYGIFVELEKAIEGLVHISEVSWTKKNPNLREMFTIGDTIETQVINIDKEERRISLSIKQLEPNPWLSLESKYPIGSKVSGKVTGFTEYGAFVELENNLEGMIHVSDMNWTRRINSPQEVLKKGQKIEAVILSIDAQNHKISLGLKQLQPNPWPEIAQRYPLNKIVEAEIVNITDFGVFVKLEEDLEGLIFAQEIDKEKLSTLKPKDKIKCRIIKVDIEQGKIGLSAKV